MGGDWNWFADKVLQIADSGRADSVTAYVIAARFVIEYAHSRVVYSGAVTADIEGVDDGQGSITGTPGSLIERPDHAFKWSLLKLLKEDASLIDEASFENAGKQFSKTAPGGYKFSGLIDRKQEVRVLWKKWSEECRGVFCFGLGKAKMFFRPLPGSPEDFVKTLDCSNIHHPEKKPPLAFKRSPLD